MEEGGEKLPVFCAIWRLVALWMDTKQYGVTSREILFTAKETHWTRNADKWDCHFQPIFLRPSERSRGVTTSVCVHHFNSKFGDFLRNWVNRYSITGHNPKRCTFKFRMISHNNTADAWICRISSGMTRGNISWGEKLC